jgi:hypothetical protein
MTTARLCLCSFHESLSPETLGYLTQLAKVKGTRSGGFQPPRSWAIGGWKPPLRETLSCRSLNHGINAGIDRPFTVFSGSSLVSPPGRDGNEIPG